MGKLLQGGKYQLDRVIGQGGFGLTFRAHQTVLDQVVVVKTLNQTALASAEAPQLQRQFQDEARRLALCVHPNVVRVTDFFVEAGLPYMVMDYIPGRSLADLVSPAQPLAEATALQYIRQIGQALQAVHAKGLLHRDVKPHNIMVHDLTGEAILIDFGIARELTANPSTTHTSIVTDGYAPVEQYVPRAQRSPATDVYGLAATLYTLVTAEVPIAAVLRSHQPLIPPSQLRPDLSPRVEQAIQRGMAIQLKDRPQSVARWLALLSATAAAVPDQFNLRSQPPIAAGATGPTQVAAPAYRSASAQPTRSTVAVTPPLSEPAAPARRPGCGCAPVMALGAIAAIATFGLGGFWLVQQLSTGLANLPKPSLPERRLPEVNLPKIEPPSQEAEPRPKLPEPADGSDLEDNSDSEDDDEDDEDEDDPPWENGLPLPDPSARRASSLPLLLANRGSPAEAQPGGGNSIAAVPGFAPGTAASQIRDRLGSPTRQSSNDRFRTAVYDLVPNRASLAYVYDLESGQVQQAEAAFSPAYDRLIMRSTLIGMLNGSSSKKIEQGLDDVRTGARDRYRLKKGGFEGVIERNQYGFVHIYVRDR